MMVTSTGRFEIAFAALRPANPAPTMTTRGLRVAKSAPLPAADQGWLPTGRAERSVGVGMTPTAPVRSGLLDGDKDQRRKRRVEDNVVGTGTGVDDQRVARRVRVGDPHEGGQAADLYGGAVRVHGDRV